MRSLTSFDEIYLALGTLSKQATGRDWWKKAKIQTRPNKPYTTIFLQESEGIEKPVVEMADIDDSTGETLRQIPWGTCIIEVRIEFWRSGTNDSAIQAATRMKNSLYLQERAYDLWTKCSLSGGVRVIDLSDMFREDVDNKAEVRFRIYANVALPLPLEGTGIYDIDSLDVDIIHVRQDGVETEIPLDLTNSSESS